jgi:hypothetical protein
MAYARSFTPPADPIITVKVGTGTAAEAAAWVHYANVVKTYGIRYWQIGNEMEGNWGAPTAVLPDAGTAAPSATLLIDDMSSPNGQIQLAPQHPGDIPGFWYTYIGGGTSRSVTRSRIPTGASAAIPPTGRPSTNATPPCTRISPSRLGGASSRCRSPC